MQYAAQPRGQTAWGDEPHAQAIIPGLPTAVNVADAVQTRNVSTVHKAGCHPKQSAQEAASKQVETHAAASCQLQSVLWFQYAGSCLTRVATRGLLCLL